MTYAKMVMYNSLRECDKNKKNIARTIILSHKTPDKIRRTMVLVEGVDDIDLYNKFFTEETVDIHDCHGCNQVERVHETVEDETPYKFFSILDSDFKRVNNKLSKKKNFFYTDGHDSEMLMVYMPNLIKSVMKRINPKWENQDLLSRIQYELLNVSQIKFFNMKRQLSFSFEGLDIANLSIGQQISENTALQYFLPTKKSVRTFPVKTYHKFLAENPHLDLKQITNGHDFITRWASIIKHEMKKQYSDDNLRKELCNCVKTKGIKSTKLYNQLLSWSQKNKIQIMIK